MDPEDFDWSSGGDSTLGTDDYSVLLIFLAFMVVIGVTSGAVLLIGNSYMDYSEAMRKKEIVDFRKKHNIDDIEKEMKPSSNPLMDEDDLPDPVDTHEKLKLACLYSNDAPPAVIGGATCIDNDTGFIYLSGGITKDDVLKKNKPGAGSVSDLHIYSSSERHWEHHAQNKDFAAPLSRAYHNMVSIYNQVLVFGGLDPQTGQIHNEVFSFDMDSSAWIELNVKNHVSPGADSATRAAAASSKVRMPAPRYNATMVPYGPTSFVIFGGKGRVNASPRGGAADVVYIPEEVCFNDVWLLHVDCPDYLYYEELYAHNDAGRLQGEMQQLTGGAAGAGAKTSSVGLYKQRCEGALSKEGAPPMLAGAAESEALPEVCSVAADVVPLPREAHCAAILGNNMFVFGGSTMNTTYTVSGSSSSSSSSSSSEGSGMTTSRSCAGVNVHDAGMVEVFDLGARVWCVCNTCGENPIGDLVGTTAHSLGAESNKIVLFSANTIEPTRPSIFNSVYVLDAALSTTTDVNGEAAPTLLLTWTRFVYRWLGDWSVLPTSRVFYGASLDMDDGLIYVFGGYNNYNENYSDITIANGDPAVPNANADGHFRNSVRMNRLSKLNRQNTSITNSLKAGVNGNLKVAEIATDVCIVDVSPLMVFEGLPDEGLPGQEQAQEQTSIAGGRDAPNAAPWGDNFDADLGKPRKLSRKDVPVGPESESEVDELGNVVHRRSHRSNPDDVGKEFYLTDSEEESDGAKDIERSGLLVKKKKVFVKKARVASSFSGAKQRCPGTGTGAQSKPK